LMSSEENLSPVIVYGIYLVWRDRIELFNYDFV